jgi:hypothetical protein
VAKKFAIFRIDGVNTAVETKDRQTLKDPTPERGTLRCSDDRNGTRRNQGTQI